MQPACSRTQTKTSSLRNSLLTVWKLTPTCLAISRQPLPLARSSRHPDNHGFVVSHVGLNNDALWRDFRDFDLDDQAIFHLWLDGTDDGGSDGTLRAGSAIQSGCRKVLSVGPGAIRWRYRQGGLRCSIQDLPQSTRARTWTRQRPRRNRKIRPARSRVQRRYCGETISNVPKAWPMAAPVLTATSTTTRPPISVCVTNNVSR